MLLTAKEVAVPFAGPWELQKPPRAGASLPEEGTDSVPPELKCRPSWMALGGELCSTLSPGRSAGVL